MTNWIHSRLEYKNRFVEYKKCFVKIYEKKLIESWYIYIYIYIYDTYIYIYIYIYIQGVSKTMSEILRAYSRGQNKKKSSYKHEFKNAFPPSYSPLKLREKIEKCIVTLGDFFIER